MDKKYFQSLFKILLTIGFVIGTVVLLIKGISLFWPFVVAYVLALTVSPIIDGFDKKFKIKPKYASFFLTGSILALIVFLCSYIVLLIYHNIPTAIDFCLKFLDSLKTIDLPFGLNFEAVLDTITANLSTLIKALVEKIGSETSSIITAIPDIFFKLIVTILASYFLIADRKKLSRFILNNSNEEIRKKGGIILQESKKLVNAYIISQIKLTSIIAVVLCIGFFIIGVPVSVVIPLTIFTAFIDFLPVFGSGAILIPWTIYCLISGNIKFAVSLLILYLIVTFVRQSLNPKVVADQVGIGAFPSLIIMYIGYLGWGIMGLILSVPMGMIFYNLHKQHFFDDFLSEVKYLINETKNVFK